MGYNHPELSTVQNSIQPSPLDIHFGAKGNKRFVVYDDIFFDKSQECLLAIKLRRRVNLFSHGRENFDLHCGGS